MSLAQFATLRLLAIAFVVSLTLAGRADAEATGTAIVGTVSDVASGLALSNATITLYRGTAEVGKTTTDRNGSFRFANEPAAVYRVDVRANALEDRSPTTSSSCRTPRKRP